MKNEVGVPLSICKICEVWIGFFPIKIYSGNFSTDLGFFMTVAIWRIPWRSWDFFKGETFGKNKYERKWERPERKAEYGEIIVEV